MTPAAELRQAALARAGAGDDAGATALFDQGLAQFPRDAALANSAGNFHAGAGRPARALALFDRALALMPTLHEAAINRAVMLPRLGRAGEAARYLQDREAMLATAPRYWTTRAAAELAMGSVAAAEASYDAALRREPGNPRALTGRASVSLQRGRDRAVADHERALAAAPGDPHLLLGLAHALHAGGRLDDALIVSDALASQLPGWTDALELHAGLRWARGDGEHFADHYARSVEAIDDPAIHLSWARMLSGVDRPDDAAHVLAAARRRWPGRADLALAHAIAAGEAGDDAAAAVVFAGTARDDADWLIAAARQSLRTGDPAAADALLSRALQSAPDDVGGWSLRDLSWRLLGDARHDWLHGQDGLVRSVALDLSDEDLAAARTALDHIHDGAAMPVGQSVRQGSQTRGALFLRTEPEIATVAAAIDRALADYRAGLPPQDPAHPLLRHRDAPWRIAGSWSIRLNGQGRHAAHIHPHGIVSSAAYLAVPAQVADEGRPGWLELGRPPRSLRVDLPPIATIAPRAGHCALFPSTLFHGTRAISAGTRMTVAFDVAADVAPH